MLFDGPQTENEKYVFVYVQKEAAPPTAAATASAAAAAVEKQKEKKMPELEKHTSHIHTSFRYRRQHNVRVLSHMRTRYFSEGSVQHPPSSYSFRRRVKNKKKKGNNQERVYPVVK